MSAVSMPPWVKMSLGFCCFMKVLRRKTYDDAQSVGNVLGYGEKNQARCDAHQPVESASDEGGSVRISSLL